jgi:hypothetical protein
VEVSGGLVESVYADEPAKVIVVDWDNIKCGNPNPERLRFEDGGSSRLLMLNRHEVY